MDLNPDLSIMPLLFSGSSLFFCESGKVIPMPKFLSTLCFLSLFSFFVFFCFFSEKLKRREKERRESAAQFGPSPTPCPRPGRARPWLESTGASKRGMRRLRRGECRGCTPVTTQAGEGRRAMSALNGQTNGVDLRCHVSTYMRARLVINAFKMAESIDLLTW